MKRYTVVYDIIKNGEQKGCGSIEGVPAESKEEAIKRAMPYIKQGEWRLKKGKLVTKAYLMKGK